MCRAVSHPSRPLRNVGRSRERSCFNNERPEPNQGGIDREALAFLHETAQGLSVDSALCVYLGQSKFGLAPS